MKNTTLEQITLDAQTITPAALSKAIPALVAAYEDKRYNDGTPADTIRAAVAALGYDLTAALVATFVNGKAWDGRIYKRNAEWAATVPGALSANEARNHYIYCPAKIHCSHLDQLADVLRRTPREDLTPDPTPTDPQEAAPAADRTIAAEAADARPAEIVAAPDDTQTVTSAETPAADEVPEQTAEDLPQESAQTQTASPINEELARRAMEMNSYSDYVPGSATAAYNELCAAADEIAARQKKRTDPIHHGKIDALLAAYKKRIAEYINRANEIDTRCPSWLVSGGSNFPTAKKAKQNAARDKNMEFYNDTQALLDKIRSVGMGGISSDDPDAAAKIEQKLTARRELQERMKAANAAIRMKDTAAGDAKLAELGFTPHEIHDLRAPDFLGRVGFANWELSNNNAEIHRLEKRLADLRKRAENPLPDFDFDGGHAEANAAENRLQLFFDGKPSDEIRDALKKEGFRWSPRFGAWQRQLTPNAYRAIKYAFGNLGITIHETADGDAAEDVTEETPTAPESDDADLTPEQAEPEQETPEQATEPTAEVTPDTIPETETDTAPQEEATPDPAEAPETTSAPETAASSDETPDQTETDTVPELPATTAPAVHTLRVFWNGIRIDGSKKLLKLNYSADFREASPAVSIYADSYADEIPAALFTVHNDSDIQTDYFEKDRATVDTDHPLYRFLRYAAMKATARRGWNTTEVKAAAAALENETDPGQPTSADVAAALAFICGKHETAEAEESAAQEADTTPAVQAVPVTNAAEMLTDAEREDLTKRAAEWAEVHNYGITRQGLIVLVGRYTIARGRGNAAEMYLTEQKLTEINYHSALEILRAGDAPRDTLEKILAHYDGNAPESAKILTFTPPQTVTEPATDTPQESEPTPEETETAPTESDPVTLAEEIAAKIRAAVPTASVEIKGRRMPRPNVWAFGVKKPDAPKMKALGCRWSPKKSGWWIAVTV